VGYLSIWNLLLSPLSLLILIRLTRRRGNKKYLPKYGLSAYYLAGLFLESSRVIFTVLIHGFYYSIGRYLQFLTDSRAISAIKFHACFFTVRV